MSDDETRIERDEPAARDGDEGEVGLVVPFDQLSAAAQRGVIEEFVTREGTDYGHEDVMLDDKVAAVRWQIERGEVVLLFDAKTERVNLVLRRELGGSRGARPRPR